MLDRLKAIPARLLEIWKGWTIRQKAVISSAIVVFIIAVIVIASILSKPHYETLITCEDYREMQSVTALLQENNYKYVIDNNSLTVKVERSRLTDAKMLIASQDIVSDGYSFEDAMKSSMTTTESDKQKQYEHYLESQFAKDLEQISGVKSATVRVSTPKSGNSFYASTAETSVGVTLNTTKAFNEEAAESIATFLATSVGNSTTKSISIMDLNGNMLFNGSSGSASVSGVGINSKLKYKDQIQTTTANALKRAILSVGLYDDATIILNYDLNWDAVNTIATEYTVQEGREEGLYKESYELVSQGNNGVSGTPGTVSNGETTYDISDGTTSSSLYTVKQYSYLPNELVTTTTSDPGSIVYDSSTIAVTLVKNVMYDEDECKRLGYLDDMTWEEFKANNTDPVLLDVDPNWVTAISRGTAITNLNNISVVAYRVPFFHDSENVSVWSRASFWVQIALAAAILAILIFIVVRSARPLTVEEKEPELSVEEMLATTKENQPSIDDIDLQEKSETRKAIEKFVDENPEAVALLLRNWLNDDWN